MYVCEPQRKGQELNRCQFLDMGHQHMSFVFFVQEKELNKMQICSVCRILSQNMIIRVTFQYSPRSGLIFSLHLH